MPDKDDGLTPDEYFMQRDRQTYLLGAHSQERERLASYLWKLRKRVLDDLGIPEWQLNFPLKLDQPVKEAE